MASDLQSVVSGTLTAAVANAGTFTVGYPTDGVTGQTLNAGYYAGGVNHKLVVNGIVYTSPYQASFSFGSSNVTITNQTTTTWPAGASFYVQFEIAGDVPFTDVNYGVTLEFLNRSPILLQTVGAPAAASATAILNAVAVASSTNVLPTPVNLNCGGGRCINCKSSNAGDTTQTVLVTGKDIYNQTMTEKVTLNGTTSVNGKKAFNSISSIVPSASLAGNLSVGTQDLFGLGTFLPGTAYVLKEIVDGATPSAGTFTAGVQVAGGSLNTSGDVRGTWAPATATNGTHTYQVLLLAPDAGYIGQPQSVS